MPQQIWKQWWYRWVSFRFIDYCYYDPNNHINTTFKTKQLSIPGSSRSMQLHFPAGLLADNLSIKISMVSSVFQCACTSWLILQEINEIMPRHLWLRAIKTGVFIDRKTGKECDCVLLFHDRRCVFFRTNICSRSNEPCSTLGLSQVSGLCQPHRSCNINEDTGLALAFTVTHELGHKSVNPDSSQCILVADFDQFWRVVSSCMVVTQSLKLP